MHICIHIYIYIWSAHPSRLTVAHPSHPTPPHIRLSQSSLRTLIPPRSSCPNPPLPTPPASPDRASPHPAAPMHPAMFTPWHEAPVRNPVWLFEFVLNRVTGNRGGRGAALLFSTSFKINNAREVKTTYIYIYIYIYLQVYEYV